MSLAPNLHSRSTTLYDNHKARQTSDALLHRTVDNKLGSSNISKVFLLLIALTNSLVDITNISKDIPTETKSHARKSWLIDDNQFLYLALC